MKEKNKGSWFAACEAVKASLSKQKKEVYFLFYLLIFLA
jgi:hypothetical protein